MLAAACWSEKLHSTTLQRKSHLIALLPCPSWPVCPPFWFLSHLVNMSNIISQLFIYVCYASLSFLTYLSYYLIYLCPMFLGLISLVLPVVRFPGLLYLSVLLLDLFVSHVVRFNISTCPFWLPCFLVLLDLSVQLIYFLYLSWLQGLQLSLIACFLVLLDLSVPIHDLFVSHVVRSNIPSCPPRCLLPCPSWPVFPACLICLSSLTVRSNISTYPLWLPCFVVLLDLSVLQPDVVVSHVIRSNISCPPVARFPVLLDLSVLLLVFCLPWLKCQISQIFISVCSASLSFLTYLYCYLIYLCSMLLGLLVISLVLPVVRFPVLLDLYVLLLDLFVSLL